MTITGLAKNKQVGIATPVIIAIVAAVVIAGGTLYYSLGGDSSETSATSAVSQSADTAQQNLQVAAPVQPKPKVSVDAETFCSQLSAVGAVFNKEYTNGRVKDNASFGPKAMCAWNGPTVTVYFGDNSYHRMSTGFGSDIYVDYEGLDFPAYKKETSTTTAGYEVHVQSDKGWAIRINDGRGLKQDITPEQYNKIAHIVNDALNQHY